MFRCVNGKACEGTRSRERREYLESVKRIGAAFAASIVNGRYPGRKRQPAGTGRGVRAVLDQQGKNDRKQNGEKKPSFHGGECDIGIRQVNSGSQVGLSFKKCDAPATVSGRSDSTIRKGKADQYEQTFTVRKR